MPNWVSNQIRITGDAKELVIVKDFLKGDVEFDFNKLIPEPQELEEFPDITVRADAIEYVAKHEDLTGAPFNERDLANAQLAVSNINRFGARDQYTWRCDFWGTKWGACSISTSHSDKELVYVFDTAWDWPEPICQLLCSIFLNVQIQWDYHEESDYETLEEDEDSYLCKETWHKVLKLKGERDYTESVYFIQKEIEL